MKYFIILALVFSAKASFSQINLKPFQTDYCTHFPEGTMGQKDLWKDCCFEHDLRYWFGGTKAQELFADQSLKTCVQRKAGSFYANLMFYGVRVGHYSPIKNKYKWGWGYSHKDPYSKLNNQEMNLVITQLNKLDIDPEYIQRFILKYNLAR